MQQEAGRQPDSDQDGRHSLGRKISHISRAIQWFVQHELDHLGIGSGQHCFLFIIYRNPGITQNQLSKKTDIDKATAAKGLSKLEKLGYIRRVFDSSDRRVRRLYLTGKGESIIPEIRKSLALTTGICSKDLSAEELGELFRLLEKVEASMKRQMDIIKNVCRTDERENNREKDY